MRSTGVTQSTMRSGVENSFRRQTPERGHIRKSDFLPVHRKKIETKAGRGGDFEEIRNCKQHMAWHNPVTANYLRNSSRASMTSVFNNFRNAVLESRSLLKQIQKFQFQLL